MVQFSKGIIKACYILKEKIVYKRIFMSKNIWHLPCIFIKISVFTDKEKNQVTEVTEGKEPIRILNIYISFIYVHD